MKQRFIEKCDKCGQHTDHYHGYFVDGVAHVYCDKCAYDLGLKVVDKNDKK